MLFLKLKHPNTIYILDIDPFAVFRSIDLRAVAAVSVLLLSAGEELQVRGPIQISLPLSHNTHLRASDTVPAWAFNQKTGSYRNDSGAVQLFDKTRQRNISINILILERF